MNKVNKVVHNPLLLFTHLYRHWPFRCVSDELYLKLFYRTYCGKRLNLKKPISFEEKIQWLKLYDRKPEYQTLTDKYLVRDYAKKMIGEQYLVPLVGVWNNTGDIDISKLPDQFVLKCNHDSASVIVCTNKNAFDSKKAFRKLNKSMKHDYFWKSREHNYLNIRRRIIGERFLHDKNKDSLSDYKFFCFDGEPKVIQVDTDRFADHVRNYYDIDWNFIDVTCGCKNDPKKIGEKPHFIDEMVNLSRVLSKGFCHVRVDFYYAEGHVYFGEMTFHDGGGVDEYSPAEFSITMGNWINLPQRSNDELC